MSQPRKPSDIQPQIRSIHIKVKSQPKPDRVIFVPKEQIKPKDT